ncbi:MAG TPA: zf-HC2 domain-containing protein [Chthonomonadaceae bacterium]|nr:zf-HC2 domain-containing protein [Chthonomonadaceae bacterium]
MQEHLTAEQVQQYARRQLPPVELLAVDKHIAGCARCRRRLAEAVGLGAAVTRLRSDMEAAAAAEPAHLSYGQLAAYAAGKLDAFDREDVEAHLPVCEVCKAKAEELAVPASKPISSLREAAALEIRLRDLSISAGSHAAITIRGIDDAGHPFLHQISYPVLEKGILPQFPLRPAKACVLVDVEDKQSGLRRQFGAFTQVQQGRQNVAEARPAGDNEHRASERLGRCMTADYASSIVKHPYRWLRETAIAADGPEVLNQCLLEGASLNFFDDLKVYTPTMTLLDEDFNAYPDGTRTIPSLQNIWKGKDAYVSRYIHVPGSRPGCWVSMAYPGYNQGDGIAIPRKARSGELLTFEASICATDIHKPVTIGFIRPFHVRLRGELIDLQDEIAVVVFRDGAIFCTGMQQDSTVPLRPETPVLATYTSFKWYHLKVVCYLCTHMMDVELNNQQIGANIPIRCSGRYGYNFTHFVIAASYFANMPKEVDR